MSDKFPMKPIVCPDGMEVETFIRKFCHALEVTLLEDGGLPIAFAVMQRHERGEGAVLHAVVVGHSKWALPKGADEVKEMLRKGMRKWEDINFPEKYPIGTGVGHA